MAGTWNHLTCINYEYIWSLDILLGIPFHLLIHATIQSANHESAVQHMKSCTSRFSLNSNIRDIRNYCDLSDLTWLFVPDRLVWVFLKLLISSIEWHFCGLKRFVDKRGQSVMVRLVGDGMNGYGDTGNMLLAEHSSQTEPDTGLWDGWTITAEDHIRFHSCQPRTEFWGCSGRMKKCDALREKW